ncbi:hypothetical protein Glove_406g61 [Diversispora epigaea]|uniref:Uncharacterized protein n=1 Tax=Diversispora epigaea TaxID=1348612 RepID=A0A397H084_9GLOM|nr:hypothetical protein Glove_406g61 [Diversispora epigaea]
MIEILRNAKPNQKSITVSGNIMPLKDRDPYKLTDVINNNIHNALYGKDISKEHYQFLVCGGTAGIGKTLLGREIFNIFQYHWTPPTEWTRNGFQVHFGYLRLDFGNDIILDAYEYNLVQSGTIRGSLFEDVAHRILQNGGTFNIRLLEFDFTSTIEITERTKLVFNDMTLVRSRRACIVDQSKRILNLLIDAIIVPDILFR